jgi:hypothetical protein
VQDLYTKLNIFKIIEDLEKRFKGAKPTDLEDIITDCIKIVPTSGEPLLCTGRKVQQNPYTNSKLFSDCLSTTAKTSLGYLQNKHFHKQNLDNESKIKTQIKDIYKELRDIQEKALKI